MISQNREWQQFEDLVRRILQAHGYRVESHSPRGDHGFDFIGYLGGQRWAIEVKYYRTVRAQPTLIETAANRVVVSGTSADAQRGMLVVSCSLPGELRQYLEGKYDIAFVDRVDLRMMATTSPQLAEELDAMLETDIRDLSADSLLPRPTPASEGKPLSARSSTPLRTTGSQLCTHLAALTRGKKEWLAYEQHCAKILKYLFPNDLVGWHQQKRTDDGLNRYDLVCRIRPATEFWSFLIEHLNSRYVIFEFKNYTGQVKQGQILTTEKYLLERGLRRAAIIFTRSGAQKEAVRATQGSMREHSKLMLVIDDAIVCEMLHMKDRGDDPSDRLFDLADDFLLKLPR